MQKFIVFLVVCMIGGMASIEASVFSVEKAFADEDRGKENVVCVDYRPLCRSQRATETFDKYMELYTLKFFRDFFSCPRQEVIVSYKPQDSDVTHALYIEPHKFSYTMIFSKKHKSIEMTMSAYDAFRRIALQGYFQDSRGQELCKAFYSEDMEGMVDAVRLFLEKHAGVDASSEDARLALLLCKNAWSGKYGFRVWKLVEAQSPLQSNRLRVTLGAGSLEGVCVQKQGARGRGSVWDLIWARVIDDDQDPGAKV